MLFVPPISMKASRVGIARFAEALPPAANALDGEGGGIGIDPDIDPALVGGDVVDAVGRDLAEALDLEIMHPHRLRIAGTAELATAILEVADQFLLLRVNRDRRITRGDRRFHRGVDVRELRIAVGMFGAFTGLSVGLATVLLLAQQQPNQLLAHAEALATEHRLGIASKQMPRAERDLLARPVPPHRFRQRSSALWRSV
jgi:hypothetical protein